MTLKKTIKKPVFKNQQPEDKINTARKLCCMHYQVTGISLKADMHTWDQHLHSNFTLSWFTRENHCNISTLLFRIIWRHWEITKKFKNSQLEKISEWVDEVIIVFVLELVRSLYHIQKKEFRDPSTMLLLVQLVQYFHLWKMTLKISKSEQ